MLERGVIILPLTIIMLETVRSMKTATLGWLASMVTAQTLASELADTTQTVRCVDSISTIYSKVFSYNSPGSRSFSSVWLS